MPHSAYLAIARMARGEWPFRQRKSHGTIPPYRPAARSRRLEDKLWGGFAGLAQDDLQALRLSPRSVRNEAIGSALALARFYAAKDNHEATLEQLAFARTADPKIGHQVKWRLLEINALLGLGRTEDARFLIEKTLRTNPGHGCMTAALASLYLVEYRNGERDRNSAESAYLDAINEPLLDADLASIGKRDANAPLRLGNLAAATNIEPPRGMPAKVSVLMAVFNGEDNVEAVIRSILDQSWKNLELVIADDASTDNSWNIICRLAEEDARIVPLQMERNGGAYVARNAALDKATGDFVVVNDADDWAHPQKIEVQVRHLLDNPDRISNMTFRLRISPDMAAQPRLDSPHVPIIHNDYSALMLPRKLALKMGGWDSVRFSADAEFVERLRAIKGKDALEKIYANVPLSFSLFDGNNLTASSATSIWTNRFGSRQEYVRQFREWHRSGENLCVRRTSQLSPYPVPGISYYGKGHEQEFDVVLVSDFRLPGGTTHCNLEYLSAFRDEGLRVAVLPWPRYELHYENTMNPKVTRLCREKGIVPLAHGEKASCQLLLIHHPPVMMNILDMTPELSAKTVAVLANQTAQRIRNGENEMYDPAIVEKNISSVFGKTPIWIPISGVVRTLLEQDGGCTNIYDSDWLPPIDISRFSREPKWRGEERTLPVVGRHSRDQWNKWPATSTDIRAAYLAGSDIPVRLMGGVETPQHVLGEIPENWETLEFDEEPVPDFVSSLDFFLHFGHPDALEAFGRNIAEAMAAGVPVICSPEFEECFGEAAIYAEPNEVRQIIDSFWRDRKTYYRQSLRGQEFVKIHCDSAVLHSRLSRLNSGNSVP